MSFAAVEQWRPVAGYEGLYEVSDLGRMRRSLEARHAGWSVPGRLLILYVRSGNYLNCYLRAGASRRKTFRVHSLVAAAFIGPRPPGYEVNHRDGDKLNNRVTNLEYVTPQENLRHAVAIGLQRKNKSSKRRPATRLSDADVRRLRSTDGTLNDVAAAFGVSRATVRRLRSGKFRAAAGGLVAKDAS